MSASSRCASASPVAVTPLSASLRWLARAVDRRIQRIELVGLSDEMKRDLGFADGRVSPPRDPLRD